MICEISILRLKCVVFLHFFLLLWRCRFVAFITPLIFVSSQLHIKFSRTPFRCMRPCMYTGEVVFINWKSAWFVFKPSIYVYQLLFSWISYRQCFVVLWPTPHVPEIVHLPTVCTQLLALDWRNWLPHQLVVWRSQLVLNVMISVPMHFWCMTFKKFRSSCTIRRKAGGNWNSFLLLLPFPSLLVPNYLWKEPLFS